MKHLEHYYKYKDLDNPALGLRLIGITQNKPNLFSNEDLDKIYDIYKSKEIGSSKVGEETEEKQCIPVSVIINEVAQQGRIMDAALL